MSKHQWPSREQWAQERRALYYDRFEDLPVSERLSDYARQDEVEGMINALRERWKAEGKKLREANRLAGGLVRQPGERRRGYSARWFTMSQSEQALVEAYAVSQDKRQRINDVIKQLANNKVPWLRDTKIDSELKVLCSAMLARYEAARKAAEEVRKQEILSTPIDDEAWEKELRRRARIDAGPHVEIIDLGQNIGPLT